MQAREQSRIPGIQNTSVGTYGGGPMDNSSITGLLTNQFGNTRKYFQDRERIMIVERVN